ncbi:INSYN2B protein-like isoform X2 [Heterodontus francisci]|uniref:INSYN2B protein-like isoform X2 n=1 Tax=Heterodontus francisci TaxID=7792 RepID=UPI00355C8499
MWFSSHVLIFSQLEAEDSEAFWESGEYFNFFTNCCGQEIMVSKETNHSLASNVHLNSDRTMTVRSVLLKRDPASSSEAERRQHRRRHKTQQVRFKDLADGPEEVGGEKTPEVSAEGPEGSGQQASIASSQGLARNWQQARPCSLTLPNPRKVCMSTAIQTSPSLQKQFPAFRFRSKSISDFGEVVEQDGVTFSDASPKTSGGEGEPQAAGTHEEEEEEEEVEEVEAATALNGRVAETARAPLSNCVEPSPTLPRSQNSQQNDWASEEVHTQNPNGSTVCHRAMDKATLCKAITDSLAEQDHKQLITGKHCVAKGDVPDHLRSPSIKPCKLNSKASPPPSKEIHLDRYSLKQGMCNKLKAPKYNLDSNLSEPRKTELPNMHQPLLKEQLGKDQLGVYPKSCLKTPASMLNPRQPSISYRTDQLELCTSTLNPSESTQVQSEPSQPPSKTSVQSGEHAIQYSQSGPSLHSDDRLELVPSGKNPQDNLKEPANAAGNQRFKSGRTTQYEITSLQSRLQTMEDVLQTSQQTIKVLLDVIQDLEKKEAVRDGQSYHTGQDIANCGTCRDCACIIYSVEHDFRQQEGRFHRVLSSMETDTGQSSEQPGTPNKQEESPVPRQPARTEPKKSKRKCFWFL